jgi:hypothetical protein
MTKRLDYTQTAPNGAKALFPLVMITEAISSHYGNYTRSALEIFALRYDN